MTASVDQAKLVHFVGIGGAGMSGLARVLLERETKVSGSDLKESRNTLALQELGAEIYIGHRAENIADADLVVVSSAIPQPNVEVGTAKERRIPMISRGEMLARLADGKTSIGVAGTHGKTTTTSMIALMLKNNDLEPTFLIGGELNDIGSNAKHGSGRYFVAETDESDGSLLYLKPDYAVLTSVETDHLDYFEDYQHIESVFSEFLSRIPADGLAIVCGDNPGVRSVVAGFGGRLIRYGLESGADFRAQDLSLSAFGSSFEVWSSKERLGRVALKVPGQHNIYNALGAVAVGTRLGIDFASISRALGDFTGVKRRFEVIGEVGDITVIDDYAHHPTEVRATLGAARLGGWRRVISVFQPHRYSRTRFLSADFGEAFGAADVVILTDVYGAGEEPVPGVSGKSIVDELLKKQPRKEVVYLPKTSEVTRFLAETARPGDLLLLMGAGDLWMVGDLVLGEIREKGGC